MFLNIKMNKKIFKEKYAKFVIPLEETEWFGLDLNTAARKLQDLEDNTKNTPLKYIFEKVLIEKLSADKYKNVETIEDEKYAKPQKSLFGEKMFGGLINVITKKIK